MKSKNNFLLTLLAISGGVSILAMIYVAKKYRQHQHRVAKKKIKNQKKHKKHLHHIKAIKHGNLDTLIHHNQITEVTKSMNALASYAASSESVASADALKFSIASANASASASTETSYIRSALLQQSLINSEDEDLASNTSLSHRKPISSNNNNHNTRLAYEVANDLKKNEINNPYNKANNHDLGDFGHLYRSEADSLISYLGSNLSTSALSSANHQLANINYVNDFNTTLDHLYSANSSNDNSNNVFKKIHNPLTSLGSLYDKKVNKADNYIANSLSGAELRQFKSLSHLKANNASAQDTMIHSYYTSLEDQKAYRMIAKAERPNYPSASANYDRAYVDAERNKLLHAHAVSQRNKARLKHKNLHHDSFQLSARLHHNESDTIQSSSDDTNFLNGLDKLAMQDSKKAKRDSKSKLNSQVDYFSSKLDSKINSISASNTSWLRAYYNSGKNIINSMKSKH